MPEPRAPRAVLALAAGLLTATVAAAPAVLAQSADETWAGSELTTPFRGGSATVATESFPIAGTFRKQAAPLEQIVEVDVRFERADGAPADPADPCLPADPAPFRGQGTTEGDTAVFSFEIPAPASIWPCNGRYRVVATAQSSQSIAPHELVGELTVAAPPRAVDWVDARYDGGREAVDVTWAPLDDLAVDAAGYRVERSGPGDAPFRTVAEVGTDATSVVDSPPGGGDYRYRVRALRSSPDGPVASPSGDSPVATVTVPGAVDPTTSTTSAPRADRTPRRPGVHRGGSLAPGRVTPRLPSPPTTADTGFDETLDYGPRDAPVVGRGDEHALAGEGGQAIIRTEDDGPGLLAPAAGALVLLGWAGHVAYLNRLAKQF